MRARQRAQALAACTSRYQSMRIFSIYSILFSLLFGGCNSITRSSMEVIYPSIDDSEHTAVKYDIYESALRYLIDTDCQGVDSLPYIFVSFSENDASDEFLSRFGDLDPAMLPRLDSDYDLDNRSGHLKHRVSGEKGVLFEMAGSTVDERTVVVGTLCFAAGLNWSLWEHTLERVGSSWKVIESEQHGVG